MTDAFRTTDQLLSLEEAAARLLLSPRQLAERAKQRDIAAIKVGRKWAFRPEYLEEYLDRHAQPSKWVPKEPEPAPASGSVTPDDAPPVVLDWGRAKRPGTA